MRGAPQRQMAMLTTLSPEELTSADHPSCRFRAVVDAVLAELDDEFSAMYSTIGRPSLAPEQLLKATVLMAMYSIQSERAFCERCRLQRPAHRGSRRRHRMILHGLTSLKVDRPDARRSA